MLLGEVKKRSYTKFEVYELFVNDYISKRIEAIAQDKKYNDALIHRYG